MRKYILITIVLVWTSSNINWGSNNWKDILVYDANGYYSYLPAVFIYGDLNFGFQEEMEQKYVKPRVRYEYRNEINGKFVNKYYVGTAILQAPFFFIAHLISKFTNFPSDGFSKIYPVLISLASIFYFIVGLFYLEKILERFKIDKHSILLVFFAIVFGTNCFVYAAIQPGMSHVYSFACVNALIFYLLKFNKDPKYIYQYLMAFLFGLIILIRPINVVVFLGLFFFLPSIEEVKKMFVQLFRSKSILLTSILILLAVVSIQPIIYKIQTGSFFVYSYKEEGFNFLNPEIFNFLFSYRKGYFLYTPIALVSLLGLFFLYKENKFRTFTLIGFLSLLVYLLSSWSVWWYGGSFSSRVMLEYSVFVFIPLGILINRLQSMRKMSIVVITLLVLFCQIQIFQYRHYDIHYSKMTKELYWENFLNIGKYF